MDSYIVTFKNDLKQKQIKLKKVIKTLQGDLDFFKKLLARDITLEGVSIVEKAATSIKVHSLKFCIKNLFGNEKKEIEEGKALVEDICNSTIETIEEFKSDYISTQKIINAFENDKVKEPIEDLSQLFNQFRFISLSDKEISRIIGLVILFNYKYAKKNKNHKIERIDIINELVSYYNEDGTFKYNEDVLKYEKLMLDLVEAKSDSSKESEIYDHIFNNVKIFSIKKLMLLLAENNEKIKNTENETIELEVDNLQEEYSKDPLDFEFLQELKKYYKNGSIIAIPENLDEFYKLLVDSNLDEKEKKYITSLIQEEIINRKNNVITNYLSEREISIYKRSVKLLDSFTYSSYDLYALKQYIEEMQTILSMLEVETDLENKEYLLSEIPSIIEQLSLICDRYEEKDNTSTNKFIFLTNKNLVPYIYEDLESLDCSYKKFVNTLISKIDKQNQASFRKILVNETLDYTMYEVISPKAHVAFVEITSGVYVIVGTDVTRSGYDKLVNRLKANQTTIKEFEQLIKNPETRNKILKENEDYLELFSEQKENKLTLKINN